MIGYSMKCNLGLLKMDRGMYKCWGACLMQCSNMAKINSKASSKQRFPTTRRKWNSVESFEDRYRNGWDWGKSTNKRNKEKKNKRKKEWKKVSRRRLELKNYG